MGLILIRICGFVLMVVGFFLILNLTPGQIAQEVVDMATAKYTLRDRARLEQGKKKRHRLAEYILRARDALAATGRVGMFALCCTGAIVLMVLGIVVAMLLSNWFLLPVFALAGVMIPFAYADAQVTLYYKRIAEDLETALSLITSSYRRTQDIIAAVEEVTNFMRPPIKTIFEDFVTEATVINSDIRACITKLSGKVDNYIFHEWCAALIACQDDFGNSDTLPPIITKLRDVRIVNNEHETQIQECRFEYWSMVALLIGNIPLLYLLNRDWFNYLMTSIPGKIVLALVGTAILVTAILMRRYTKPIEYKR